MIRNCRSKTGCDVKDSMFRKYQGRNTAADTKEPANTGRYKHLQH